jgi:hypothetical protein
MKRTAIALSALAMAAVPAATASADYNSDLQNYSQVREQLYECNLDVGGGWDQLSSEQRKDCDPLFRDYVLFWYANDPETLYIHCRSADRCLPTPDGFYKASDPLPSDATVYDIKPSGTAGDGAHSAGKRHHKHHRKHHR